MSLNIEYLPRCGPVHGVIPSSFLRLRRAGHVGCVRIYSRGIHYDSVYQRKRHLQRCKGREGGPRYRKPSTPPLVPHFNLCSAGTSFLSCTLSIHQLHYNLVYLQSVCPLSPHTISRVSYLCSS